MITSVSGFTEKTPLVHKYFATSFLFFTFYCCLTVFLLMLYFLLFLTGSFSHAIVRTKANLFYFSKCFVFLYKSKNFSRLRGNDSDLLSNFIYLLISDVKVLPVA